MAPVGNQFSKHKWWILTVLLTLPVAAIAAGVPNVFTSGTVISSAQVNANFQNLSDRVTTLEGPRMTVQVPINGVTGSLMGTGKSATFTTTGGQVLLIASGTAWISSANGGAPGLIDVAIQVDGVTVGHLRTYTNELNSHKAFPTLALPLAAAPAAGSHTLTLLFGNAATTSDPSDVFTVTVVEYH